VHPQIKVALIVCNKPEAGVLDIAREEGIPSLVIERERFSKGDGYVPLLIEQGIRFIVLAGFLWKVPLQLLAPYKGAIVNIHPALLPKFGGKGMYGEKVHSAVLAAGEPESGITIHYVDELYDHGASLFQATCPVLPDDTPQSLAKKVLALEHAHYARIIEEVVKQKLPV
jgi:phosphoribosylglycinamide formyltransferase-1